MNEDNKYPEQFQAWVASIDPNYHSYRQGRVGPGWLPLLTEAFEKLRAAGWKGEILQIKEKFGSLRLYISNTSPVFEEIVNRCEEASRAVCEECGATGSLRRTGDWLSTLCDVHAAK